MLPATVIALWPKAIEYPEPFQRADNVVRGKPRSRRLCWFPPVVAGQCVVVPEPVLGLMCPQPGDRLYDKRLGRGIVVKREEGQHTRREGLAPLAKRRLVP